MKSLLSEYAFANNRRSEITGSVFLLSMSAFFLSALMTTIGSVIDGFVIGHTMKTGDVAALSLTSPCGSLWRSYTTCWPWAASHSARRS